MAETSEPPRAGGKNVWGIGEYARLAGSVVIVAEELCEAADLRARERVLDVGTGTGNAALAAARRRCTVTGVDPVGALLDHARRRAEADLLRIDFREGTAERLEFPDGAFDCVLSAFGVIFAADPRRASGELLRVCRPGGRVALTAWTGEGWTGPLLARLGRELPTESGIASSLAWSDERYLRDLFGAEVDDLRLTPRSVRLRADSADTLLGGLARFFGPLVAADARLEPDRRSALRAELAARLAGLNRATDGTVLLDSPYVEVVARRAR